MSFMACKPSFQPPEGDKKIQLTDLNKLIHGNGKDSDENRVTKMYDFGLFKVSIVTVRKPLTHVENGYMIVGMMVLHGKVGLVSEEKIFPVEEGQFLSFPPLPGIQLEALENTKANLLLFQIVDLMPEM